MTTRTSLVGGAAVGVLLAATMATGAYAKPHRHHLHPSSVSAPSESAEIAALKADVESLQDWRQEETIQRSQQQQQDQQQISQLQGQLADAQSRADRAEAAVNNQIETIPGVVDAAVAKAKPKTDKLYYKGVTVTLGGFAAAESVYRSRNEESDIGSSYSGIPFANNTVGHTQELHGTARQSRISFLAQGDVNPDTHLAFYGEFDFLGAGQTANSKESDSYQPRIRNVYGTVDWDTMGLHFLAGQNWSLVTLNNKGISPRNEVIPPTIEAQYVPGFDWARQPQLRIVKDFNKEVWLGLSLENPQTTFGSTPTGASGLASGVSVFTTSAGAIVTGASGNINGSSASTSGASQYNSLNAYSFNHIPDVIGKLAWEPKIGGAQPVHVEVLGLYRSFEDRATYTSANPFGIPVGIQNNETSGWGIGAGLTWTVVPKLLDVEGSVLTGRGIGRYGSAQLPDTYTAPNGTLTPIPETMFLGGATLHATPALDVYVFGGEETQGRVDNVNKGDPLGNTTAGGWYGFGNPNAALGNCSVEGASCTPNIQTAWQITAGFWDKVYNGPFGQFRVGIQYSHTELDAFPGLTGAASGVGGTGGAGTTFRPKTTEDMVFTSFRYYPF